MLKMFVKIVLILSIVSVMETNKSTIDPRIRLIEEQTDPTQPTEPAVNLQQNDCPSEAISGFMTGCSIESFKSWHFNITGISDNGLIQSSCVNQNEDIDCVLKFCCALFQSMDCMQSITQYLCPQVYGRTVLLRYQLIMGQICPSIMSSGNCRSLPEFANELSVNSSISGHNINKTSDQTLPVNDGKEVFEKMGTHLDDKTQRFVINVRINSGTNEVMPTSVVAIISVILFTIAFIN